MSDSTKSMLEMSDEELMALDTSFLESDDTDFSATEDDVDDRDDATDTSDEEEQDDEASDTDPEDEEHEEDDSDTATDDDSGDGDTAESDTDDDGHAEADGSEGAEDEASKGEADKTDEATGEIDYKAAYERLTAPFKANGREMRVDNVEDAIQLMQMGANYNKKMAALKPNLKMLKMLENNGFLSDEKIGYLIDLGKKKPEAISKLVKDSGIDPMDIDTEKQTDYKPTSYTVADEQIELDSVVDDLKGSAGYNQTIDIVLNKWDEGSQRVISKTPQILKVINEHVENGIYSIINDEVERQRTLGRLNGLSDLEAYRQVGDSIRDRGGFDHLAQSQGQQTQEPVKKKVVPPKPRASDPKLSKKRKAASSTRSTGATQAKADFNPLSLSDEEFAKQFNSKFL